VVVRASFTVPPGPTSPPQARAGPAPSVSTSVIEMRSPSRTERRRIAVSLRSLDMVEG
jgi:hypothetical protein